ncbi:polymerase [Planctomycetales bacterium]|nr:polymerase [Planctomycetales bacterium]GHS97194.1 polymerase [Planctomycetales bacterium]GHT05669.1 polymerase [Planctomycetales bacterium]GHV21258.1 polymerase [Planctomycetales bacterium]
MNGFSLKVNPEAMTAKLAVVAASPQSIDTPSALEQALAKETVLYGIDKPAIRDAFADLPKLTEGTEILIAAGTPAVNGKNGFVEFLVNVSGKPLYDGAALADGELSNLENIDYKNAMRIVAVKNGDALATVHSPTLGSAGKTLAGKALPARDGKAAVLLLGEGVVFAADGVTVLAAADGQPVYSGKTLSVSQSYEVRGDVGFDTGNIKFDGYVIVRGCVKDEFAIEAKNVEIDGVVGAAKIVCRENLIAHGGVNGRGKAVIVCQGSIDAKYLINCAKCETGGDLNVAKEIFNSTVWCRGTVRAGKIMGGETLALRGVEAKQFGSDIGTPTVVVTGVNYELRRVDDALKILCHNITHVVEDLGANFGNHKYFLSLSAPRQNEIKQAYYLFDKLQKAHQKLTAARQLLLARADRQPLAVVVAQKVLHHDVTLKTANYQRRFLDALRGPITLSEDPEHRTIKVEKYGKNPFAE